MSWSWAGTNSLWSNQHRVPSAFLHSSPRWVLTYYHATLSLRAFGVESGGGVVHAMCGRMLGGVDGWLVVVEGKMPLLE